MQNKYRTTAALALAGVATVALGALTTNVVSAQEDNSNQDNFIQALASKLGIDESKVETAVNEVREEQHAEREAEMEAKVSEAVSNGDLTERQAEIINAMHEIREEQRDNGEKPERPEFDEDATQEERQQEMIDALNEKGLDVTSDELDTLHDAMKDLGLGGPRGGRGPGGMGMMK